MTRDKLLNSFKYEVIWLKSHIPWKPIENFRPVPQFYSTPSDLSVFKYMEECKKSAVKKRDFETYGIENIKDKKYLIVIPHHERVENILSVLDSFTDLVNIGVVVVDSTHILDDRIIDKVLSTGNCYIAISQRNEVFNKSDCMNIAYSLLSNMNAEWFIFHDTDVVLSCNFEESFMKRISNTDAPAFFQCFGDRRVAYLGPESSQKVKQKLASELGISVDFSREIMSNPDVLLLGQGAPGGSIAVHRDLFEAVGGYDADWYEGYGAEDASFFTKCVRHYTKEQLTSKQPLHQIQTQNLEDVVGLHMDHDPPEISDENFVVGELIQPCLLRLNQRQHEHIVSLSKNRLELYKKVYSL